MVGLPAVLGSAWAGPVMVAAISASCVTLVVTLAAGLLPLLLTGLVSLPLRVWSLVLTTCAVTVLMPVTGMRTCTRRVTVSPEATEAIVGKVTTPLP